MGDEKLPEAIHSDSFHIGGVEIKCHVLDDGRGIIEAESIERLFAAAVGPIPENEIDEFSKWCHGLK